MNSIMSGSFISHDSGQAGFMPSAVLAIHDCFYEWGGAFVGILAIRVLPFVPMLLNQLERVQTRSPLLLAAAE